MGKECHPRRQLHSPKSSPIRILPHAPKRMGFGRHYLTLFETRTDHWGSGKTQPISRLEVHV